jgi:hypothetical protein
MLACAKVIELIKEKCQHQKIDFQQDKAPAHRAKLTEEWLSGKINVISDWPPNSPELPMTESISEIFKMHISRRAPAPIAG